MRLCCFCGDMLFDITPDNEGYCNLCQMDVTAVETTEIKTVQIEYKFFEFECLDLLTQIEVVKDSKGSHKEKINILKRCIEVEYWRSC